MGIALNRSDEVDRSLSGQKSKIYSSSTAGSRWLGLDTTGFWTIQTIRQCAWMALQDGHLEFGNKNEPTVTSDRDL